MSSGVVHLCIDIKNSAQEIYTVLTIVLDIRHPGGFQEMACTCVCTHSSESSKRCTDM
jgi:hypothetical protein